MDDNIITDVRSIFITMRESPSFNMLVRDWKTFGLILKITGLKIDDLESKLRIGSISAGDIPYEVLQTWKAENGTKATWNVLRDTLFKCDMGDIAELLQEKFGMAKLTVQALWKGKFYTLRDLLGNGTSDETYQRISNDVKQMPQSSTFQLIKQQLNPPETPEYYLSRTLSYRTEIDVNVFQAKLTRGHIFLVKGISKLELARATGFDTVEYSGKQLHEVTVRFIVLQCDKDFECISSIVSSPVHLLQKESNNFVWVKSSQGLDILQQFFTTTKTLITEDSIVQRITDLNYCCAINISAAPGIGKTQLLANLATKVQDNSSRGVVLFIAFKNFVQQMNFVDSSSSIIKAIIAHASGETYSRLILEEMLRNDAYQLYLFLDGYDEVPPKNLDVADQFLNYAQKLRNVRIIVTSRSYIGGHLNSIFNNISYDILPFTEPQQVEFVQKYWASQYMENRWTKINGLTNVAVKCLTLLETTFMDENENKQFAGTPLHCKKLADECAKEALRFLNVGMETNAAFSSFSLFYTYRSIIEFKFGRLQHVRHETNLIEKAYSDAHIYEAINLLFPDWIEIFRSELHSRDEIDEKVFYSVGLLEKCSGTLPPRFLNRAFAEFLLAEFITKNLNKLKSCVKLLFDVILGLSGVHPVKIGEPFCPEYRFKYPNITYVLDKYLKFHEKEQFDNGQIDINYLDLEDINIEDICVAVVACCCADLKNCLDLSLKFLHYYSPNINTVVTEKYFQYLPYISIKHSENFLLVKQVMEFTSAIIPHYLEHSIFPLRGTLKPDFIYRTPLHFAIFKGNYNIVAYLIDYYRESVKNMNYLLHACVYKSARNNKSVIEDKLSIIELLLSIHYDCFEETYENRSPVVQDDIHETLYKCLGEIKLSKTGKSTV